jgi:hypothetical protein
MSKRSSRSAIFVGKFVHGGYGGASRAAWSVRMLGHTVRWLGTIEKNLGVLARIERSLDEKYALLPREKDPVRWDGILGLIREQTAKLQSIALKNRDLCNRIERIGDELQILGNQSSHLELRERFYHLKKSVQEWAPRPRPRFGQRPIPEVEVVRQTVRRAPDRTERAPQGLSDFGAKLQKALELRQERNKPTIP